MPIKGPTSMPIGGRTASASQRHATPDMATHRLKSTCEDDVSHRCLRRRLKPAAYELFRFAFLGETAQALLGEDQLIPHRELKYSA